MDPCPPTDLARPNPVHLPGLPVRCLRLGVVSFLNMYPLVHGLDGLAPDWKILPAPPSKLLGMLRDGLCDVAMLPAFDYLANRDRFGHLPGSCIGSRGPADSVLILSHVPIAEAEALELDANSHTSNALARLLLRGPLSRPDMPLVPEGGACGSRSAAYLRIGNRAMQDRHRYKHCIDMGEAWFRWQGLPFVFAVWATRGEGPWDAVGAYLAALRDDNLCHIEQRLAASPGVLPDGIDLPHAVRYFKESLCYRLGPEEELGLQRFGELLKAST